MKKYAVIICLFITGQHVFGQQNILQGKFKQAVGTRLYLYSFYGLKTILLDSCIVNKGGYAFTDHGYQTGFYRLSSGHEYVDCILEENNTTIIDFEEKGLKGKANALKGANQKGLMLLKEQKKQLNASISSLKSGSDNNDTTLVKTIKQLLQNDEMKINLLLQKYENSFFANTALLALGQKPDQKLLFAYNNDTLKYFKEHFFDAVDFTDESLSRSTILPNLYMRYLSKYVDYDETGFKDAANLILSKAKANPVIYNLSLEYLLEIFEKAGPEVIFEYILDKYYLGDACSDIEVSSELEKKITQYQQLLPGQPVPGLINCINKSGNYIHLDSLNAEFRNKPILLFFWSTHCHFCQELISFIKKTESNKNIVLIGINIYKEKTDWMNTDIANDLSFINLYTPGGWESETARRYMVNKTPTVYLLKENLKISRKNLSLEEIKLLLSDH